MSITLLIEGWMGTTSPSPAPLVLCFHLSLPQLFLPFLSLLLISFFSSPSLPPPISIIPISSQFFLYLSFFSLPFSLPTPFLLLNLPILLLNNQSLSLSLPPPSTFKKKILYPSPTPSLPLILST